jgi:hypothetical protein
MVCMHGHGHGDGNGDGGEGLVGFWWGFAEDLRWRGVSSSSLSSQRLHPHFGHVPGENAGIVVEVLDLDTKFCFKGIKLLS